VEIGSLHVDPTPVPHPSAMESKLRATPVGASIWVSTLKFGGFGGKNQLQQDLYMDLHFPYSSKFPLPPSIPGGPTSSPPNVGPTTFLFPPSAPLRLSSRLARTETAATRDVGAARSLATTARRTCPRGRTAATPRRCGTRRRSPPRRRYGGRTRASSTPAVAAACARELHPAVAAEAHSIRTTTSSQYARSGEKRSSDFVLPIIQDELLQIPLLLQLQSYLLFFNFHNKMV
jgi:hypothetical protein